MEEIRPSDSRGGGEQQPLRPSPPDPSVPPLKREAAAVFRRELPQLLNERHGQWVAYHGAERIGFAPTREQLVRECVDRGLKREEILVVPIRDSSDSTRDDTPPASKLQRFEKVLVMNSRMGQDVAGQQGSVISCDQPYFDRRIGKWRQWIYCVYFPALDRYRSFLESDLESTGDFDAAEAHLGKRFEISFDTVQIEDMTVVDGKRLLQTPRGDFWFPIEDISTQEGCYRIPGQFWQVFIFEKGDVSEACHHFGVWESGITGIEFDVPEAVILYRDYMIRAMSEVFGAKPGSWIEVRGLDSLVLK